MPPSPPLRRRLSLDEYVSGVLAADRTVLARAITLIESRNPEHQEQAEELLERLLPRTGGSHRIGISGVPGVGKSTFIEALGSRLTAAGHRLAVLAVDPTSTVSGGSILGDKTRMTRLARDPGAFVRPSPSGGHLGGVHRKSRETLLLCEAAGFDIVLVETVGVGQSETTVAEMADTFLVLLLAGAGDELQGIKRGILELADLMAINKADGANLGPATKAQHEYTAALHYLRSSQDDWQPRVLTCSAQEGTGLDEVWDAVLEHRRHLEATGGWEARRQRQALRWMWATVEEELGRRLRSAAPVAAVLPRLEEQVLAGELPATVAARRILRLFLDR